MNFTKPLYLLYDNGNTKQLMYQVSQHIEFAQVFVDIFVKEFNNNLLGGMITDHLQVIPYHNSDNFASITLTKELWNEMTLNIMFIKGGRRSYCKLLVLNELEYDDPTKYYHFKLYGFMLSMDLYVPFNVDQEQYRGVYDDAKESLNDRFERSFKVEQSFIDDKLLKYKLETA